MKNRVEAIEQKVRVACERSHRSPFDVKLVAVAKSQSVDHIRTAVSLSLTRIGENYVQEFLDKYEELKFLPIEWHFIGHLQSNKVKNLVGKIFMIHSVDSAKLAEVIDQKAAHNSLRQKILLQVNLADEMSKGGFSESELRSQWPKLIRLKNIEICGLMIIPPAVEDAEEARPWFHRLKSLLNELQKSSSDHPMDQLSMGMSHDYSVAIEEGATFIRVGTAIFGDRI